MGFCIGSSEGFHDINLHEEQSSAVELATEDSPPILQEWLKKSGSDYIYNADGFGIICYLALGHTACSLSIVRCKYIYIIIS